LSTEFTSHWPLKPKIGGAVVGVAAKPIGGAKPPPWQDRQDDSWHDTYIRAPRDSRAWINPGCERHVVRDGSWGSDPDQVRSAFRLSALATTRSGRVGFRVARDL